MLCLPAFKRIAGVVMRLGGAFTSRQKALGVLTDREFQFGAKLWFCAASVLVGIVILQKDYAEARAWSPYFGYITIPIIFDMRVGLRAASLPHAASCIVLAALPC